MTNRIRMNRSAFGMVLCCGLASAPVVAAGWVENTEVAGFLSARYSTTDEANYLYSGLDDHGINEDGSFYGTKLGLNIATRVSDDLSVQTQLFSALEEDRYATHLDWAFANLSLGEEFALRLGKIKYPVGLVNEYVDVGVAYPWIEAPLAIYSESADGPQATREAYTGASLLWTRSTGDWNYGVDLFSGQVNLNQMTIKGMVGVTARANWDEQVEVQLSTYSGEMKTANTAMSAMNNRDHSATTLGVKADWHNIVAYAEAASVEMDLAMPDVGDSDSWYATLGYRIGKWLPHFTVQDWELKKRMMVLTPQGHKVNTLGLNYSLSPQTVVKFEVSDIDTTNQGLFYAADGTAATPSGQSRQLISLAIDVVF